jgi:hypothetical protein
LLCKKVVAFFSLLTQSQGTGVRRLGVTQELLSLVTGLAHYLKLLIRICLQGALKLERETKSAHGLTNFLSQVNGLDGRLEEEAARDQAAEAALLIPRWADSCPICDVQVEDKCVRITMRVWSVVDVVLTFATMYKPPVGATAGEQYSAPSALVRSPMQKAALRR